MVIYFIAHSVKRTYIHKYPMYKYYVPGLYFKILGGTAVSLTYVYYYNGGDTTIYFQNAMNLSNLLAQNPANYLKVITSPASYETFYLFNYEVGYPTPHYFFDTHTFFAIKVISIIVFLSFNSYIISTLLIAWVSYYGIWKLYLLFCHYYKYLSRELAIGILFLPSVVFWGSGLLKDTITLSASCWFIHYFHEVFILKYDRIKNIPKGLLAVYIILSIKPYIVGALLPGTIIWSYSNRISKLKNSLIKMFMVPFIYVFSAAIGLLLMSKMSDKFGKYSADKVIETTITIQKDMKGDHYGQNKFDIGEIDPSFSGLLSKFPKAVTAGLFRPYIWEISNFMMLFSGLENLFILFITISALLKLGIKFFKLGAILTEHPLLLFCISYSVFFAYSIGITTANFGALVRFKIAFLPMFICSMYILRNVIYAFKKTQ